MTGWPPGVAQVVFQVAVRCRTPGTAAIAFSAAGVTGADVAVIATSAPVLCQEAAISPRVIAWLTIPAKVARLSASTSANAGSTPASEDRAAPARATKPVAPARRDESLSRPPTASGYSRSTMSTTGMVTRTGVTARYRLIPPLADTPWSCRITRPATEAATAVTSATRRRNPAMRDLVDPSRPG